MLVWAASLRHLRFGELMTVYADSNKKKAKDWPDLPQGLALQLAEQDHRQYLADVFFKTKGTICAVWEVEGQYVSALRLEPYRDGLLLEALETAPSHRKKGYAAALIRAVQAKLAKQGGIKLYSHVNKRNMPSLKTHECCGFRVISDHAAYINGSVDHRSWTLLCEV